MKFGKKKEEEEEIPRCVLSVRISGQQLDIENSFDRLVIKRVPSQDGKIWVGVIKRIETFRAIEIKEPVDYYGRSVFSSDTRMERKVKYEQHFNETDLYLVEKGAINWKLRIADAIAQRYKLSDYHRDFLVSNLDNIT
jgi:hypothetical protein